MSTKCGKITPKTLKNIRNTISNISEEYLFDDDATSESFEQNIIDYLNTLKDKFLIQDADLIANAVHEGISSNDIEDDDFINILNFKSLLIQVSQGVDINLNSEANMNNALRNVLEAEEAKEVSSDFLTSAYGSAESVKEAALIETNTSLFDALFVNRGSITESNLGVVSTINELNENILKFQQQLLNKICNYLRTLPNLSSEVKEVLKDPKLYKLEGNKYVNTNILYTLQDVISRTLSPNKYKDTILSELFEKYDSDPNAKLQLDAYNANLFLKHFDSYLELVLGKVIDINPNEFGKKTGSLTKYKLSGSMSELSNTWRTDENFDPSSEVSALIQMLVNTTPIYDWNGSIPIKGRYLTFLNYLNIIGKIKALGVNPKTRSIVFDYNYLLNHKKVWDSLSKSTLNLIAGKKLSKVINSIRKNPRLYIHSIFEIFANEEFRNSHKNIYEGEFIQDELKHLYSIYKGLFKPENSIEESESFKNLVGKRPKLDYYAYLAQVSDSIFKNQFILYYRGDSGELKTRVLTDMLKFRYLAKLKSDINSINRRLTQRIKQYNFNFEEIRNEFGGTIRFVTFTIPNTDLKIKMNLGTGDISGLNDIKTYANDKNVLKFLDDILGLNISKDLILKQLLDNNFSDLVRFATKIATTAYFSETEDFSQLKKLDKLKYADEIFKDSYKFNIAANNISLISDNDASATYIINKIVEALLIRDGQAMATLVKDSLRASLNLQSLSRLLGSFGSQFDLLETLPDSATKDLSILTNPDLLLGHYTTSEYYDKKRRKSKKATKFTVSEMAYANLMNNFIPAFLKLEDDLIGDGRASFIASVNSDKGTIGLLLFNLHSKVKVGNELKEIIELTLDELESVISKELGTFYFRSYSKIKSDLGKLSNFMKSVDPNVPALDYLTNFAEFNNYCQIIQVKPSEYLQNLIEKYNQQGNRLKPLTIIDLIHYITNKDGSIIANNSLIAQLARFNVKNLDIIELLNSENYEDAIEYDADLQYFGEIRDEIALKVNNEHYPSIKEFFASKCSEVLWSLVKSNTKFNISENNNVNDFLKGFEGWTLNGKMTLAKITFNGISYNITSKTDLYRLASLLRMKPKDLVFKSQVQLHPKLELYNTLDYWLTQSWMDCTVGTFASHPGKKYFGNKAILDRAYNLAVTLAKASLTEVEYNLYIEQLEKHYYKKLAILQEAAMYQDLHKRNVSMTALMHEFSLNLLNGITEDYNVAVVDDIKDLQTILSTDKAKITPYDGATFVNPFTVYLENNSLGAAKAGFDKKQFIHAKHHSTGSGIIIKTAGFAITNDRIRRSPNGWRKFMLQMTDHVWINENGEPINVNILKGFDESNIEYKPIYFAKNGELFKITHIEQTRDINGEIIPNAYSRTIELVNRDGSTIKILTEEELKDRGINSTAIINSNFKLWEFFGGEYALELDSSNKLIPSEVSIENVVTAMNSVGLIKEGYTLEDVETLEQLWQPLKHSDIHYLATAGAVKQGAANINSNNKYNTTNFLNYFRIKMYQAGILLDKEHHADDAELSLPTLIISACAALGYTIDIAHNLYQGLANASYLGTLNLMDLTLAYFEDNSKENTDNLKESVLELVAKNLANLKSDSFAKTIAKSILEAVKNNPNLKFKDAGLPLSDNTVFNKMISTIVSNINKSGIKLKIPGLLAVLTPSHNLYTLFGNRTWDELYNWTELDKLDVDDYISYLLEVDPDYIQIYNKLERLQQLLEALQYKINPVFDIESNINDIHKIQLGRYYDIEYDIPSIDEYINDREQEIIAGRVNLRELAKKAKTKQLKNKISDEWEISNIHDYILLHLPSYYRKVDFNSIVDELGGSGTNGISSEVLKLKWLAAKNGMSIAKVAEDLHSSLPEHLKEIYTSNDIRSELIDILRTNPEVLSMWNELVDRYVPEYDNDTDEALFQLGVYALEEYKSEFKDYQDGTIQINTPALLRQLKKAILLGKVKLVTENITKERNLGAYNVRGKVIDELGNSQDFQLWELDSIYAVLSLIDLKDKNETEFVNWFEEFTGLKPKYTLEKYLNFYLKQVQEDLKKLSKSVPSKLETFDKLIKQYLNNPSKELKEYITRWIQLNVDVPVKVTNITDKLYLNVMSLLRDQETIFIDGKKYFIDKNSIETEAYELIMPKIFINQFGFEQHTDLNKVKDDTDWFVKQFIRNLNLNNGKPKPQANLYDIELKNSNGKHYYIIDQAHLEGSKLRESLDEIITKTENGKVIRVDGKGEPLYEIINDSKIYVDAQGNEIIVVRDTPKLSALDTINKYINSLSFDTINLSLNLINYKDDVETLVTVGLSENKRVKKFIENEILTKETNTAETILKNFKNLAINNVTEDNYKQLLEDPKYSRAVNRIIKAGRRKHSAFLKSLDIVAARIPSLSLQSFMPMKIVAYDNPNRNAAYVSNLLILLQGSDF